MTRVLAILFLASLSAIAAPADAVKLGAIPSTNVVASTNHLLWQESASTGGVARLIAISNLFRSTWTLYSDSSNAVFLITNDCQIVGENTNRIIVTSAGTAAANGTYNLRGAAGGDATVWTNSSGYGIWQDDGELPPHWMTNSAGSRLYETFSGVMEGAWDTVVNGTAPAPTVNFEDSTNCQGYLVIHGVKIAQQAINNAIYVDPLRGLDQWGLRGRPDRPWQTITNAIKSATNDSVIFLQPGTYNMGVIQTLVISNGVKIIGPGIGVAVVTNNSSQVKWEVQQNTFFSGFTIYHPLYCTAAGGPRTNIVISAMEILGWAGGDCLFGPAWGDVSVYNSRLRSSFDVLNDTMTTNNALTSFSFYNCDIEAVYTGAYQSIRTLTLNSNVCRVYGGRVAARNGAVINACFVGSGASSFVGPAVVELHGTALVHSSTNGLSHPSTNIVIRGSWVENGTNGLSALYVGTNLATAPFILSGSASPSASVPNGSIYLRTDGSWWLRTNNAWIIK